MTTPNGTPAPTNGAPTQTQQPAPATQTQSEPDWKAKLAEGEAREVRLKKDLVVERQQWAREKQTFGEKLKDADAYARLKKTASVDRLSAARELFGENFLEELNAQAASGGAPTAASMQHALERVREDTLREVEERTTKQQQAQQARETQAEQADRAHLHEETTYFYGIDSVAKEFPLLGALGDAAKVGETLASNISGPLFVRYRQALAANDGNARAAVYREVAAKVEAQLEAIIEKAVTSEKWAPRLREKLTPPKTPASVSAPQQSLSQQQSQQQPNSQQQGRRSLTNDIATGSTPPPGEPKQESDDERRRRLAEKYAPAILKRT